MCLGINEQGGDVVSETFAKSVRDAMHDGCECIAENKMVLDAAKLMEQLDIGVLPICGNDDRLIGMLTDRDIVVRVLAHGKDPATTMVGELARGTPITIAADASIDQALSLMREHTIKRLPVLDGKRLCGIITEADIATHTPREKTGELLDAIASAQPQHF
jgi:CBS domain-containing protein